MKVLAPLLLDIFIRNIEEECNMIENGKEGRKVKSVLTECVKKLGESHSLVWLDCSQFSLSSSHGSFHSGWYIKQRKDREERTSLWKRKEKIELFFPLSHLELYPCFTSLSLSLSLSLSRQIKLAFSIPFLSRHNFVQWEDGEALSLLSNTQLNRLRMA